MGQGHAGGEAAWAMTMVLGRFHLLYVRHRPRSGGAYEIDVVRVRVPAGRVVRADDGAKQGDGSGGGKQRCRCPRGKGWGEQKGVSRY